LLNLLLGYCYLFLADLFFLAAGLFFLAPVRFLAAGLFLEAALFFLAAGLFFLAATRFLVPPLFVADFFRVAFLLFFMVSSFFSLATSDSYTAILF
jgi:hypothetical protein